MRSAGRGLGADAGLERGEGGAGVAVSLTKGGEIGNGAIAGRDGEMKRNFFLWCGRSWHWKSREPKWEGLSGGVRERGHHWSLLRKEQEEVGRAPSHSVIY